MKSSEASTAHSAEGVLWPPLPRLTFKASTQTLIRMERFKGIELNASSRSRIDKNYKRGQVMEEQRQSRLFSRLRASYTDKKNTFSWALIVWAVSAVALSPFMEVQANLLRSVPIALAWSAIHIVRRM
jgi:hypothetical protein